MRRSQGVALEVAFVALLSAISFLTVTAHQRDDSPTFDETYHLLAAAEYVLDGTFFSNLEHPPLMKDLAGFALRGHGVKPPSAFAPRDASATGRFLPFVYFNALPPDRMLALARRPFPWLLVLLVVTVWATTRAFFGAPAAALAAALVAFEPNLVAHAGVVHTDLGAALTTTLAVALAALAARRRGLGGWALAGGALGIALATKFTAVLLVPCVVAIALLPPAPERGLSGSRRPPRPLSGRVAGALVALASAGVVVYGVYAWNLRRMPDERREAAVRALLVSRQAPHEAIERHVALSRLSPPLGHYAAGLASVARLSSAGRGANFFRGHVSDESTLAYFPVALAIKSTPSFLVATLLLFVLGGRRLASFRALVFLGPAAVLFGAAVSSRFNIGVRHVLPVYPLLAIVGAGLLASRLTPRTFAALAAALGVGSATSLAFAHPHEMSYFNALVGPDGPEWLSDSNVDWGQDLKRLGGFLSARGWTTATTVVAYGGLSTDYFMPGIRFLPDDGPFPPGRYAVGATMEAIGRPFVAAIEGEKAGRRVEELVRLLRSRGTRVARVGSITIWELPGDDARERRGPTPPAPTPR